MSKFLENDDSVSLILPRTQQKYSSRVRARHLMAFGLMLQCLIFAAETNLPLNATTQWVGFFFIGNYDIHYNKIGCDELQS